MPKFEALKIYLKLELQAGKAVRPYRADGYVNMMTRYGTQKDASEQYKFVPEDAVPDELLTMYYDPLHPVSLCESIGCHNGQSCGEQQEFRCFHIPYF